jgi:hypothetical protein
MQCLKAARLLTVDPNTPDREVRDHIAGCPACASYRQRLCDQDRLVLSAHDVPVPSYLRPAIEKRIKGEYASRRFSPTSPRDALFGAFSRPMFARLAGLAMAISLLAIAGFHMGLLGRTLPQEVLGHVKPYSFDGREPASAVKIEQVLAKIGLSPNGPIREISYAANCQIEGKWAAHVVFDVPGGKATVFLMPQVEINAPIAFDSEYGTGMIVPMARGSAAIIAPDARLLRQTEDRLLASLQWHN